ncbi:hypothetical protein MAQ5080_03317 [Marinomonas aquimarina]|uniref:Uncharacterized protein n=1 Tax=Marinomonas aquimarina TaxID=295068 RepID=A0A1A8TPT9_9GAMM|nr:hypothetical protein [Marinomonas aquimarina]SBS35941.1 hypothetical protein MAQ5080_03317 [Marinomonas aquimarina]
MKKWIFSLTVSLLLASSTLATNVTTSLKTEQVAVIEGYKSGLFLAPQQFKSDKDKSTNKKCRTVHTENLTQDETEQLIVAIVTTEVESGYQGAHFNLPRKLHIEKDTIQPEERQYTLYNGEIQTVGM